MAKRKRTLSAAEKREKKRRKRETMIVFINGKQKRVPRPPMIEGMEPDEFIRRNADLIWLHQNEMWDVIHELTVSDSTGEEERACSDEMVPKDDDVRGTPG